MAPKRVCAVWFMVAACGLAVSALADDNSRGPNGINATGLGLTGAGITIGQVEPGRPGMPGLDGAAVANGFVSPFNVYLNYFNAIANLDVDNHAMGVAGTMISGGAVTGGVAPGARLLASSIGTAAGAVSYSGLVQGGIDYGPAIMATERLFDEAFQFGLGNGLRAINYSYGYVRPGFTTNGAGVVTNLGVLDGGSWLTRYVDWATRFNHDGTASRPGGTLFIIAGNETGPSRFAHVPTDTFNGIVVGALRVPEGGTRFTEVASYNVVNQLPSDGRRTVHIVAPGGERFVNAAGDAFIDNRLELADLGTGNIYRGSGTSFAAPHVTATVALLQEHYSSNYQTYYTSSPNGNNELVMRAVILNSADKVQGVLGMDRTIYRGRTRNMDGTLDPLSAPDAGLGRNRDWLEQREYESRAVGLGGLGLNRDAIPLDTQLGVGALNASRAVTQFSAGQQGPGNVGYIGWNYARLDNFATHTYTLVNNLAAGDWVSATLCWNREVRLVNNPAITPPTGTGGRIFGFDTEVLIDRNNNGLQNIPPDLLYDLSGNNLLNTGAGGTGAPVFDTFNVVGLNDFDLFLYNITTNMFVARSNSSIYSLEHIFFQVTDPGQYALIVFNAGGPVTDLPGIDYGLAWWTVIPTPGTASVLFGVGIVAFRRRRA